MESKIVNLEEYKNKSKHGYKITPYVTSDKVFYSPYYDNEEYEKQLKLEGLSLYNRDT